MQYKMVRNAELKLPEREGARPMRSISPTKSKFKKVGSPLGHRIIQQRDEDFIEVNPQNAPRPKPNTTPYTNHEARSGVLNRSLSQPHTRELSNLMRQINRSSPTLDSKSSREDQRFAKLAAFVAKRSTPQADYKTSSPYYNDEF